jgi:hypothetical protein
VPARADAIIPVGRDCGEKAETMARARAHVRRQNENSWCDARLSLEIGRCWMALFAGAGKPGLVW